MSAPDPFEQHRAAFGAELRRVAPTVRRRRRQRLFALGGASVALAAAGTAAVVVVGPAASPRLDVVADARAAITEQPGSIVHFSVTMSNDSPRRTIDIKRNKGCEGPFYIELWREVSSGPPRYRTKTPMNPCGVAEMGPRIATGDIEMSYGDRTSRYYSESDGFMQEVTKLPAIADEMPPVMALGDVRLTDGDPSDPVARIRSLLAEGKLRDAGELEGRDGRKLRRLVGEYTEQRGDPNDQQAWPVRVDYRVDAATYAPVLLITKSRQTVQKDPDAKIGQTPMVHRTLTERVRFRTYETIPLTPESEKLLTVQPAPGTDLSTVTSAEMRSDGYDPGKPSKAERARAKKITDAQIAAGTRVRAE